MSNYVLPLSWKKSGGLPKTFWLALVFILLILLIVVWYVFANLNTVVESSTEPLSSAVQVESGSYEIINEYAAANLNDIEIHVNESINTGVLFEANEELEELKGLIR